MLVLTVKPGEPVHIGEDVTIHVLSAQGQQVRVGFEAPSDIAILRDKVKRKQAIRAGVFRNGNS